MNNAPMPSAPTGTYDAYAPDGDDLPRAESPPPLPGIDDGVPSGRAVEMDAVSTISPGHAPQGFGQYGIRESDADVAGMLALQQARTATAERHDTYTSDVSKYSQEE
jgi:hypothetical protein